MQADCAESNRRAKVGLRAGPRSGSGLVQVGLRSGRALSDASKLKTMLITSVVGV